VSMLGISVAEDVFGGNRRQESRNSSENHLFPVFSLTPGSLGRSLVFL